MPTYYVDLVMDAFMRTHVRIQATSREEAETKAIELNPGDLDWSYAGSYDGTLEVTNIEVTQETD